MSDLPTSVHRTRAEQSSTWERQFTPKQIYAGMGLAHLAIILTGVYRLLTVRGAEWRLIIIVVIVLDICHAYDHPFCGRIEERYVTGKTI